MEVARGTQRASVAFAVAFAGLAIAHAADASTGLWDVEADLLGGDAFSLSMAWRAATPTTNTTIIAGEACHAGACEDLAGKALRFTPWFNHHFWQVEETPYFGRVDLYTVSRSEAAGQMVSYDNQGCCDGVGTAQAHRLR